MTGETHRFAKAASAGIVSVLILVADSTSITAGSRLADPASMSSRRLLAQSAPAPTTPGAAGQAPAASEGQPARPPGAPAAKGPVEQVEARISQLRQQLHITSEQEPQFKIYANVIRSNAQVMQALFQERAQHSEASALGQRSWYAKLTAAHSEAVKLVPVFEALYQSLSDQQKKKADAVFAQVRERRAARRPQ